MNFFLVYITFITFIVANYVGVVKPTGGSFLERFNQGTPIELWDVSFQSHIQSLDVPKNVVHHRVNKRDFADFNFRNDCTDIGCCVGETCFPYTSGMMTSMETYGYGSFRWLALASQDRSDIRHPDDEVFVQSFFSLIGRDVEISIVMSNKYPFQAELIYRNGAFLFAKIVKLDFNSRTTCLYRIDWTKDSIKYIINGDIYYELTPHQAQMRKSRMEVPRGPLKIEVGVMPKVEGLRDVRTNPNLLSRSLIWVRLRLFRMRYISQEDLQQKDEMLILKNSKPFQKIIVVVIGFIILFAFIFGLKYLKRKSMDHYTLMEYG